jgi:hypothetical protein
VKRSTAFLVLLLVAVAESSLSAATFVEQSYRFIALTSSHPKPGSSQHVVWIVEDRSGEGHSTTLLQIILPEGDSPLLIETALKEYGDWQWLTEGAGKLWTERFRVLAKTQRLFSSESGDLIIQPPLPNEAHSSDFREFIRQGHKGAHDWNDARGLDGFDPPRVEGDDWVLAYYYPAGLYINYDITEIYYFERARYLLLFTHQDMLEAGMDTMHGFIILRLSSE